MARSPNDPFAPPPAYATLRADEPVARVRIFDGSEIWLVTRYEDVKAVLSDPRMSADVRTPGFPDIRPSGATPLDLEHPTFFRMDEPEHMRQRRMVLPYFTARATQTLRPQIQSIVDRVIDEMMSGGRRAADLVEELAFPVPSLVICALLDVPYEDHEFFQSHTQHDVVQNMTPQEAEREHAELWEYMDRVVARKRADPGDDVLSRLLVDQVANGQLTHEQVIGIAILLLNAGHLTTASMIGLGALALLQHPDQLAAVRADPALIPGAVDELLRWLTVVHLVTARVATAATEIGGQVIRPGEGVFALTLAGNHDESRYPNADRLDVRRNAHGHLAFGDGPHFCVGHTLARVELEVVFATLLGRLPRLELAVPFEQLEFTHDEAIYRVTSLPVQW